LARWAQGQAGIGWLFFFNRGYLWTLLIAASLLVSLRRVSRIGHSSIWMAGLGTSWFIYMGMTHLFVYPLPRITFPLEWISLFSLAFLLIQLKNLLLSLLSVAIPGGRKSSTRRN
jgi:hypothetical protein